MNQAFNQRRVLIVGHILDCFNDTLYGFFAVMLSSTFFDVSNYQASLLGSYGAFAAGFLARPIGAIIMGTIGDQEGRRKPLLLSIGLIGFPTIGISLIPSFEQIGLIAPTLLICFRLCQGFLMGGEFTGVNLYNLESSTKVNLGKQAGAIASYGALGAVLATFLGSLVLSEGVPGWAWRLLFALGGCSSLVIYLFFKEYIKETEDFISFREKNDQKAISWKDTVRSNKRNIITSCFITGLTYIPLYFSTIFGNRLFMEVGYSPSACLLLNMGQMIYIGILVNVFGRLSDKLGFKNQIILGACVLSIVVAACTYKSPGSHSSHKTGPQ